MDTLGGFSRKKVSWPEEDPWCLLLFISSTLTCCFLSNIEATDMASDENRARSILQIKSYSRSLTQCLRGTEYAYVASLVIAGSTCQNGWSRVPSEHGCDYHWKVSLCWLPNSWPQQHPLQRQSCNLRQVGRWVATITPQPSCFLQG